MGKAKVGTAKPKPTKVRVLLPHEVLHALATVDAPFVFDAIFLGNLEPSARSRFWTHVSQLDPWVSHPVFEKQIPFEKLIGVMIHGDGAVFKREDECFVWSFSSVFGHQGVIKDPLILKIPICIIPERHMLSSSVHWRNSSILVRNSFVRDTNLFSSPPVPWHLISL